MITLEHIYKSFKQTEVLHNVSMELEKGKCNLVIGESGSGKTILMKTMVGLMPVNRGKVFYGERDLTSMNRKELKTLRQEMGMLFQGAALFDSLSIEENVMFPLNMFTGKSTREKISRVNFCLERVGLEGVNRLKPAELSGGMKKRAAIARAIVLSPDFLFCDEPNSGLDPKTAIRIDGLIKEITEEYKITTVVNSHDMNSVLEIGDKVFFIYQGEKAWEGSKEEILSSKNDTLNEFVFASSMAQHLKRNLD